jgi:hypothetical protein
MLISPTNENTGSYRRDYDKKTVDNFINEINYETSDISGKTLFLQDKIISQSKLRDAGFFITRNKDRADVIVISDIRKKTYYSSNSQYYFNHNAGEESYFNEIQLDESKGYKYILDSDIYKYLYKYEGNQDLLISIEELLTSGNNDNAKMAMEFMSNANWTGNEIYLMEIFSNYYGHVIRGNSFKNSISFKGFLASLEFNYESIGFYQASNYRKYCKNEEHHQWVHKKYCDKFEEQFKSLAQSYKIKIDKLEFSIDKGLNESEDDDE